MNVFFNEKVGCCSEVGFGLFKYRVQERGYL
jgi:hypothetical protein